MSTAKTAPSPESDDDLLKDAKNLRFELLRQAFYHADEFWFFLFADRATKFLSVMAATAVIGSIYRQHPDFATTSAVIITALQMIGLVFSFHTKGVLHDRLRERYFSYLTELESRTPEKETLRRIKTQMFKEWEKEPVTYWGIEAVAYNSALLSMTSDPAVVQKSLIKIGLIEKWVRHVYRFSPEHFHKPVQSA